MHLPGPLLCWRIGPRLRIHMSNTAVSHKPLRRLYCGDNFNVIADELDENLVALVYLDPPFNSDEDYSLFFGTQGLDAGDAQWTAFRDTWLWDKAADDALAFVDGSSFTSLATLLRALLGNLGKSPMMAYLVFMAARLIRIHGAMKPTASIYLHCDPSASHYLKPVLDAIFGARHFRSEIIWRRTGSHSKSKRWAPLHDTILYYTKSDIFTWNAPRRPLMRGEVAERLEQGADAQYHAQVAHEAAPDIWAFQPYTGGTVFGMPDGIDEDVRWLSPRSAERLGYPSQKPVALLTRIIEASSNKGDVVLDPFCGCGTTLDAAERLERQWIGIDVSPFTIQLIRRSRLEWTFPDLREGADGDYQIEGLPTDLASARDLAQRDLKAFQIWAVTQVDGRPNENSAAGRLIHGLIPFRPNGPKKAAKWAVVSVVPEKADLSGLRKLDDLAKKDTKSLGFAILICLEEPTDQMLEYCRDLDPIEIEAVQYPRLQILTIKQILSGERPQLPLIDQSVIYRKAGHAPVEKTLFD